MDRGAWRATVHSISKSRTRLKQLSTHALRLQRETESGSRLVASDSSQPYELQPSRLLCPWEFPGKNTGVSGHFLLQGIFLSQRLNWSLLCLLLWQVGSLPLTPLGKHVLVNVSCITFYNCIVFCIGRISHFVCLASLNLEIVLSVLMRLLNQSHIHTLTVTTQSGRVSD